MKTSYLLVVSLSLCAAVDLRGDSGSRFHGPQLTRSNIQPGGSDLTPARLGSWGQTIKDPATWDSDDPALMVDALIGTGQNFCIYNINREGEWTDFQKLLEAAQAASADIQFFAAMQSPTTVAVDNRWFGTDGPPVECVDTHDYTWWTCQRDYIVAWKEAWKSAAVALSDLSVTYPNLAGFVIDDFDQIESLDLPQCLHGGKLSKAEVKEISDACKTSNAALGLWPSFTVRRLGRFLGKGYTLGANYGLAIYKDEYMSVTLPFELKIPVTLSDAPKLSFFHRATLNTKATNLIKSVQVDGIEIWPPTGSGLNFTSNSKAQYTELSLGALSAGPHDLTFMLYATGQANSLDEGTFWYIWDVSLLQRLAHAGGSKGVGTAISSSAGGYYPLPTGTPQFSTYSKDQTRSRAIASGIGFVAGDMISAMDDRGWDCSAALTADPTEGYSLPRFVAAPNDPYLIADVVAGFAPYTSATESEEPDDALETNYDGLLASLKGELGTATRLMMVHWIMDDLVDTSIVTPWITEDAATADYTAVWNYPIGLYYLATQQGVFAQQVFPDGLKAFFPGRQSGLKGWYQRWISKPWFKAANPGKTVKIEVNDNHGLSSDTGIFETSVYQHFPLDLAWQADVATTNSAEVTTLSLMTIPPLSLSPLAVSLDLVGGVGKLADLGNLYQARRRHRVNVSGPFEYQTGVDDSVQQAYDAVRSTYLGLHAP